MQLRLLSSLLVAPSYNEAEETPVGFEEPEEIDLFEVVEYDPEEEIEELLSGNL